MLKYYSEKSILKSLLGTSSQFRAVVELRGAVLSACY